MSISRTEDVHLKEASFHDAWARETRPEEIDVRAAFEAPCALENRFIIEKMGDLRGKRLLDIGAGLGDTSVYFALKGAAVTAVDVSPGMVECARRLAAHHGVELQYVVCAAEKLDVPDAWFDFVYAGNIIHHVADREAFFAQIARVLKPGGRFFSTDPVAYNPAINVYRRLATETRTDDERPLTLGDVTRAKRFLVDVGHREFWIAGLAIFIKYFLCDGIHPNEDRYWKRILREKESDLWWWRPLNALDSVLTRIPLVRWLSWNIVLWGRKP